jgi:hypothetical protein
MNTPWWKTCSDEHLVAAIRFHTKRAVAAALVHGKNSFHCKEANFAAKRCQFELEERKTWRACSSAADLVGKIDAELNQRSSQTHDH